MQQVADTSNNIGSPTRTPQQRGRRIELLLWVSGVVLLCVAWATAFQVIATMRASAISAMQFAELMTLRGLAGDLQRCAADHPALSPAQFSEHCVAPVAAFEDGQTWIMPAAAFGGGAGAASVGTLNAHRIPPPLLAEMTAGSTTPVLLEGSSTFERDPQSGTEIAAWTATNIDGAWWVIGVATPLADVLATTGIPQQGMILAGLLGLSTLIALLLLTVTASSVRRQHEAEQALTNANAALESRVAQRTAELVAANTDMLQEIDRRLQVEQALQASEERSRSLLNAMPDLMLVLDRAGNYLEVRGDASTPHHQTAIDAAGTDMDVFGPRAEDLPLVHAAIAAALSSGATQEVTYRTQDPLTGVNVWTARLAAINPQEVLMLSRNITDYSRALETIEQANQEVLSAYDATLLGWSRMLEVRENEVAGHSQRVAALTMRLASALGCSEAETAHIRRGALLHDIGKMALPDAILRKAGALTEEERRQVQQHPILAHNWLNDIAFLRPALDIPYCHHERWNGGGYPRGLCGEEIPLAARIFSVVDVWDALLADRPYKVRWTRDAAKAYLREQAGDLFDPHVVAEFIHLIDKGAA